MRGLVIVGTRPEAIKLAPVIRELQKRPDADIRVILNGQHRDLPPQGLAGFHIRPHHDLDLMQAGQSVNDTAAMIAGRLMTGMEGTS